MKRIHPPTWQDREQRQKLRVVDPSVAVAVGRLHLPPTACAKMLLGEQ
jgi:hypothetical protein